MTPRTDTLRLNANEGIPALPDPGAILETVLLGPGRESLCRYPDPTGLEAVIARWLGVEPARVLVTAGADDGLDRVCRSWLSAGRELVVPVPTFEMIPRFAGMCRARLVEVDGAWEVIPLEALRRAIGDRTGVVALVTPSNPSGAVATAGEIRALARVLPPEAVLLLDAAYVEFADEDPTTAVLEEPNVIVVRTLSKAWGLAGLRVGYVVGEESRIRALRGVGGPFPVSGPSVAVATTALETGEASMQRFVDTVCEQRGRLIALLGELGAGPMPSQANFVFSRFEDAGWVRRGLAALGIQVRGFESIPDGLRITVPGEGTAFDRLERGLRTVLAPEALLFDMDGVLVDVSDSHRRAIAATCAAHGVEVGAAEIQRAKAEGDASDDWELTRRLLARAGKSVSLVRVREAFEAFYQGSDEAPGFRTTERLIPSRGWLEEIASRVRLGIVTGRPEKDALRFLEEAGVRDLFPVVVAREDAPLKPSPAPVRLALERLGVRRAWLLGDTPDDVIAARRAGVVPVGVCAPGDGPTLTDALYAAGAAAVLGRATQIETRLP